MDGILVVNKPAGITSFDVIRFLKRLIGHHKIGHTGTLDPMATGVLPLLFGKATKKAQVYINKDKEYVGEMVLGITTDSQDIDGKVLSKKTVSVSQEEVEKVMASFSGEIDQVPPMFSAAHHKGKRLYKLARKGEVVEREPKKITIKDLELLEFKNSENPTAKFRLICSKGTYVRTLCADIGEKLGCGAYLDKLERTKSGPFRIEEAHTFAEIEKMVQENRLSEVITDDGSR